MSISRGLEERGVVNDKLSSWSHMKVHASHAAMEPYGVVAGTAIISLIIVGVGPGTSHGSSVTCVVIFRSTDSHYCCGPCACSGGTSVCTHAI